jgi:hypothetical protein
MGGRFDAAHMRRFERLINCDGPVVSEDLGPCHDFTGRKDSKGYGLFTVGRALFNASRYAWEAEFGGVPEDKIVSVFKHLCGRPSCCNVAHLRVELRPKPRKPGRRSREEGQRLRRAVRDLLAVEHPQTVRQVYYQLVSMKLVDKTQAEYGAVSRLLT